MPRNRKYFPNKAVTFITTRTEEGLPLVATDVMNFIIWGILARARNLYNVKVCHFLVMPNHLHMMLVIDTPSDTDRFMSYVKGELAHGVNRLLGRRQKTIWQDGYDSPILLTPDEIRRYIKYTYRNPSKARFVDYIEEFPGVSSWEMFKSNNLNKLCPKLSRDQIPKLSSPALTIKEQERITAGFNDLPLAKFNFILEPDAWRESFPRAFSNQELIDEIKKEEDELRIERIENNIGVIGATALRRASMLKEYVPTTYGQRSICICHDLDLRRAFIEAFKYLVHLANKAYTAWKQGDHSAQIPPGMFSPRRPELASALSIY